MKIFPRYGIERLYFKPDKKVGTIEIPEIVFTDNGIEHRAVYYRCENRQELKRRGAILIAHGNAGNIYNRRYLMEQLLSYCECDIYYFEYPGFGSLQGTPSISGSVNECIWWYKKLLNLGYFSTDLYGESIGGAIIMKALLNIIDRTPIRHIYLQSAFSSIKRTIKEMNTILYWLYKISGLDHLNTSQILEAFDFNNIELILIHSYDDDMVSIKQAFDNFHLANTSNKKLYILRGGHNKIELNPNIFK